MLFPTPCILQGVFQYHSAAKFRMNLTRWKPWGSLPKVSKPTEWCAGMVVVPQKSGKVRICDDFKALNDNVREVYSIPKVDETLAQLVGASIFSKLDANSEFWKILLSMESKLPATLCHHQGANVSINSSSEYPAHQSYSRREWVESRKASVEFHVTWMMPWYLEQTMKRKTLTWWQFWESYKLQVLLSGQS